MKEKGNIRGLLPIGAFLVLFIGVGIVTKSFDSMPAVVAFLIALAVALCQNSSLTFQEKIRIAASGVGDENIITMCLIFLAAGAFSGSVSAAGGVESTVNLGLSVLPPSIVVAGLMMVGCFISLSMGTSMGTISALAPIAAGVSEKAGFPMAVCIGAVVSGAMFGDNLSMISDTTIAAVRTQGCQMKDKFKENFIIVLPAALLSIVLYAVVVGGPSGVLEGAYPFHLLRILPYLLVLMGALAGVNVFVVLIGGTLISLAVGVGTGSIAPAEIFQVLGDGVMGMYDITVISILVAAIVALVRNNGGIAAILSLIRSKIKGEKGGEYGIAALSFLVDAATANNTVAIVMAGPIAKEISDEYGISPKRTASLLDIFTAVGQGLIPYGAQLLLAAGQTGTTPFEIMPYLYYPILMGISALIFIGVRSGERTV